MSSAAKGKKLINSVERCVDDCIAGLVCMHPGLRQLDGHRVVEEAPAMSQLMQVGDTMYGYIGPGMLSAAVAGAVFTSPPPGSILAAIRAIGKGNPAGVLVVVKNYTGDRLNFGLAVERAKAEGIKVDMVMLRQLHLGGSTLSFLRVSRSS
nr:hypothetical protein BaRGS_020136 [Batillaria attramentaria]